MSVLTSESLQIRHLAIDVLRPNSWNTNRVSAPTYAKLKAYVEREGMLQPLVVRPADDGYEIISGEHRWRICRELGHDTVPCIVAELDDARAKILSVNLNELKGASVPALLAELVQDLSGEFTADELSQQLPYDANYLGALDELLDVPEGFADEVAAEAERMDRQRKRVLSFAVSAEEQAVIEAAVDEAGERSGARSRGAALTYLCEAFVGGAV